MENNEGKNRNHQIDTMKTIAIFLVVAGHALECLAGGTETFLYKLIYSIHMPLFVFISGYLAKFNFKKMLKSLLIPLAICEIMYATTHAIIFKTSILEVGFPYWLLWYLLSLFFWKCTIPILQKVRNNEMIWYPTILGLFILGLLVGYIPFVNKFLSLSRTITFYPFFVMGFCFKSCKIDLKKIKALKIILPMFMIGVIFALIYIPIKSSSFYLAEPYVGDFLYGNTILQRIVIYIIAFFGILFLLCFIPSKQFKGLQTISNSTLYIYLTHGLVIEFIKAYTTIGLSSYSVLLALVASMLYVVAISILKSLIQKSNVLT